MAVHQAPNLLNLENKTRQQPKIAHEQGAGSQCVRCGPKCSGFDLHYWRKICRNCRCGKENHLVKEDEDPSSRVVRLLDHPSKTATDGGRVLSSGSDHHHHHRPTQLNFKSTGAVLSLDGGASSPLDWVPPAADNHLAVKYIEQLPAAQQPITGSQAAVDRKRALDRQLPSHDLDPDQCTALSVNEKRKMEEYVNNVRQFVVGQGLIQECPPRGRLPLPPPQLDRILGEKVSQLTMQSNESTTGNKPVRPSVPQFITAKPFVKIPTDEIKRMSAKPNAGKAQLGRLDDEHFDLPPPPPEMLINPQGGMTPPPPPPPTSDPSTPVIVQSENHQNKQKDPVQDFFDFLDEQEGKKLPGRIKSPFLHQTPDNSNTLAKPYGVSPGQSPNLNQRPQQGLYSAVPAVATPSRESPPQQRQVTASVGPTSVPINGNQPAPRRLMTTDFDYVPDNATQSTSSSNNNNPPVPVVAKHPMNNNPSPQMDHRQVHNTDPVYPVQEKKTNELPSVLPQQAIHPHQQEVFQEAEQQWSCRKCEQFIEAGTVAIFAERAGSDKCWHPQCFVCSICNEMLADLIYFFVDDAMFCGRHYAEQMKIPRCKACDELIFAPEYTSAEGASWHMDHFCCWLCDTPLAGHQYTPIDGQPHCLDCYQKKYGKDCYECGRPIRAEETRVSHGEMNWHNTASCFKCRQCQTAMINRQFILKNGQIYCSRGCVVQHAQCLAQPVLV